MNEVQEIKLWDDWDEINLSTPERQIEQLEILLCQKIHKGEDISQCLEVLQYLKNRTTTEKVEAVIFQEIQNKLTFKYWQRIGQAALIFLVAISCCFAMYQLVNSSLSIQREQGIGNREQETMLKNVGLKQGHRFQGTTCLEKPLLLNWALNPANACF
ncbi:hypothetical protein H6G94_32735 [Nostoc punctiforme FACHB-252]|jgi:hypothetical protein|uniref:Uncharacterized protein n=1 Tax=Nostoc punctiforme FACHB-252 TaxID=1357509 RepID=A0ABR8HL61_NOSPU|nr:hypothetical protein [Nostoc punctiforme]MBD2615959.1 hypothetical protein [Nostoc punctiforme FACHB-252]